MLRGIGEGKAIALAHFLLTCSECPRGRWLSGGWQAPSGLDLLGGEVPSEVPVVGSVGTLPYPFEQAGAPLPQLLSYPRNCPWLREPGRLEHLTADN